MVSPNCLCKLKHFTFYLRDLVLERANWDKENKSRWPILHDLVAITTLCCLKNEGFKLMKNSSAFGWIKYDNEAYLREFRSPSGKILICCRLNGFLKFLTVFQVCCVDGEVQLRGQVHNSDDEELSYYEMKAEEKIASSIHFALCGGYCEGQPVFLQYDVPRLLKTIYKVIEPVREYITLNWQFTSVMDYIKHLPLFLSHTIFGYKDNDCEGELDEMNGEGKFKARHVNMEKLMFLSPEMIEAQVKAELVLYHYRDNEKISNSVNKSVGNATQSELQMLKKEQFRDTPAKEKLEKTISRNTLTLTDNELSQSNANMEATMKYTAADANFFGNLNADGTFRICNKRKMLYNSDNEK